MPHSLSPVVTPPRTGGWSPLLTGDLAVRAEAALAAIAKALPAQFPTGDLATGSAGAALFYSYLHESGRGGEARAHAHLGDAIASLGEGVQWPSFYSGFTGIAWAVEHLQGRLVAPSEEDLNEDIDAGLEQLLSQSPWPLDYDLVSGLIGYGTYGWERQARPSGQRILHQVLTRLQEIHTRTEGGLTWHTHPDLLPAWQRELDPEGYFNLGLAHGVPGIIALLGQASALGFEAADPLLEGAVSWLLAQRLPEGMGSCFASVVPLGESGRESRPTRISWCYGDLGLGLALLLAARATGRRDWEASALEVLRISARRTFAESGTQDAGLCHGAAGNGHLYNRIWQATGEPVFREAALRWFESTLTLRHEGRGIAGFQAYMPAAAGAESRDPWVDAPGLLEGATGIGLALLAALSPQRPEWDRCLLIAVDPLNTD